MIPHALVMKEIDNQNSAFFGTSGSRAISFLSKITDLQPICPWYYCCHMCGSSRLYRCHQYSSLTSKYQSTFLRERGETKIQIFMTKVAFPALHLAKALLLDGGVHPPHLLAVFINTNGQAFSFYTMRTRLRNSLEK